MKTGLTEQQIVKMKVEFEVVVTNEDIDDIMCSALEGGINYWCCKAEVIGDYLGEYGSDQISRGGQLKLHDYEDNQDYILTREKFVEGFKRYLKEPGATDILEFDDRKLKVDCGQVDAEVADSIIQYALFDDVIYG